MVFNFRKKALENLEDLIIRDPGEPEPDFGVDQPMVDLRWEHGGKDIYPDKATMVDALGGIDAMRASTDQVAQDPDSARNYVDDVELITTMSAKPFNLSKNAQYESPYSTHEPANYQAEQMQIRDEQMGEMNSLFFKDHSDLKNYLDNMQNDPQGLMNDLKANGIEDAKEAIDMYYAKKREVDSGIGTYEELLDYVNTNIFQMLPPNLKDQGGQIMTDYTQGEVQKAIKKMAEENTKNKEQKPFNLNKTAQHKTQENVIMWGPSETRKVDPFLRQPVSDWHIIERNKGFGLVVDDIWNIDYETIWRENIMDKYYRPYRDKDGNWVGGYIQKRFEVDKDIPASSNMQIMPGQTRKPVIPEHGITESRLQAARASGEVAGANDTSKPFNWKEASSKKKSLKK